MIRLLIFLILQFSFIATYGQEYSLGLKFTPPEKLQGIPLASTPFSGNNLPESIDLSNKMPPAGNQGKQSSCVGWAVGYACKSYQERLEEGKTFLINGLTNKDAVFSPAFIYNQINNGVDGGSSFVDALNLVSQQGAVKWVDMPYNENDFISKPNDEIKSKAKIYRIDFWRRVNFYDIKEVKAQLNAGYPVIIGAMIDQGFLDNGRNTFGEDFTWSSYNGSQLGGHAMLVVGFDDNRSAFKVLNSWGLNWGNNGYCWISYSLFTNTVREAYVMKDATNEINNEPTKIIIDNPTKELSAEFNVVNVQHNIFDPSYGKVMRFFGNVVLPDGIGSKVQVVIKFYLNDGNNNKGIPISSYSPYFMMPDGSAACGTPKVKVKEGFQNWFASIPYQSLNVPRGVYNFGQYQPITTYLIAEPILYIDDFAVETGKLIPFFVSL